MRCHPHCTVSGFYDVLIGHTGERQGLKHDRQGAKESWVSPLCKKLTAEDAVSSIVKVLGSASATKSWILSCTMWQIMENLFTRLWTYLQEFQQTTIQKWDRKLALKPTYKTLNLLARQNTLSISERTSIYIYIYLYIPYTFPIYSFWIPHSHPSLV